MRTRWNLTMGVVGALAVSFAWTTFARPDDISAFLGTYETVGRYSNLRNTAADIEVARGADGKVTVTRTGRYTARRWRRVPPFTWTSTDARLEGETLRVTYRVTKAGVSFNPGATGGLVSALGGDGGGDSATVGEPAAEDLNVFEAVYTLEDGELKEELQNTKRIQPEHWWRSARTKGPKLSSPEPEDPAVTRVKLGGEVPAKDGRFTVVVPTDGTLKLKTTAGTIKLLDPSGAAVPGDAAAEVELDIPHADPKLGLYTAVVEGVGDVATATLSATFTQDGRIDPRIRPWSSHTWYPISDGNSNALFVENGPLDKLDRALGLTDKDSAVWWEKGTDYRTGFGFERGHYVAKSSPSEERAEAEWYADLDYDGVIEKETAEEALTRFDANGDGKVDRDEAKTQFENGVITALWSTYDSDSSGKVTSDEIFSNFVTTHDADSSGDIDATEWAAAMRKSYSHILAQRSAASIDAFMSKDADGDGLIAKAEMDQPGAVDFQDSSDVDKDLKSFFDRDNIKVVAFARIKARSGEVYYGDAIAAVETQVTLTRGDQVVVALAPDQVEERKDAETHYGNKVTTEGGKVKLFKGRLKDELVVELDEAAVKARENGVADGDLDDSYSVGWWGHCNAWSMAAIVFRKPAGEFEKNGVTFTVRDQKGILVELGMGDTEDSTFWWQQWGGDDIPANKYTAGFHRQMHRWLRVEQKGMMADMDLKDPHNLLNFAVWNYPLLGYVATFKEAEGDDPYVLDVDCKIEKGSYSDEDSSGHSTVKYRLHFDAAGAIQEGDESKTTWLMKNSDDRNEYIRYLIHPFRFTGRGSSGNPNVTIERLEQAFGEHLKYNRLEDLAAEDADGLNTPPPAPAGQ